MHRTNVVSSSLGYIAFLLLIYSISTSHWATWNLVDNDWNADAVFRAGLWKRGYTGTHFNDVGYYCTADVNKPNPCPAVDATRALCVIAVALAFIGATLATLAEHADGKVDKKAPAVSMFAAGFFVMVGWAVWLGNVEKQFESTFSSTYEDITKETGYSQIMVILSWLLLYAAGGVALMIPNQIHGKIVPE